MRSDFYYWLTTVVIVTVLFGLFIEFLWTTAKVPDIVCRIPDSGYYRISQILPDNPALPDIRYIPSLMVKGPEYSNRISRDVTWNEGGIRNFYGKIGAAMNSMYVRL